MKVMILLQEKKHDAHLGQSNDIQFYVELMMVVYVLPQLKIQLGSYYILQYHQLVNDC